MTTSGSNVTDSSREGWRLGFSLTLWIDLASLSLSFLPFRGTIVSPERADRSTPPRVCAAYIESVLFPSLSQTIAWGVFSWEHLSWWGPSFSGLTMSYVLIAQQHQRHGSKVQTWTRPLSAKRSPESLCCLHIKCGFPGYFQSSSPTTSAISRRCLQQVLEVLDIINSWAVPKYIMPWHNLSLCRKHPFPLPPGQHGTQSHSSFKKKYFIEV